MGPVAAIPSRGRRSRLAAARGSWRNPLGGWLIPRLLLLLVLIALAPAVAELRFPPPEFESGHTMPDTIVPPPRATAMEYVDVAVLLLALGVASHLSLVKRSRKGLAALSVFSVLYFGFYREGCVCAIGSIQNVALAAFNPGYALPLTVGVFFLAPIVVALFFGRAFCAGVCPHGAIQDLMLLKPVKVPLWLEQGLGVLPFIYLGAGVLFAATGSAFIICRADPFIPIFRLAGPTTMVVLGIAFLVLAMFVGRPYCRFMCPYGAVLRMASMVSKWYVRISPAHCSRCRICEEVCPYGAIRHPSPNPEPAIVAGDRRRLIGLAILLPVLMVLGGWMGSRLVIPWSRMDANVVLAEELLAPQRAPLPAGAATPESLALGRAEANAGDLLTAASRTRQHYAWGGWLFGGWMGLVVGAKLTGVSLRSERKDYEPDRGACLSCGRCFKFCPHEKVRRAGVPALIKPIPAPMTAISAAPQSD